MTISKDATCSFCRSGNKEGFKNLGLRPLESSKIVRQTSPNKQPRGTTPWAVC